jgi:hypothetical protein
VKPIACPHCGVDLRPNMPKLWGSYMGSAPRPGAKGKKRPGIGGRKRKDTKESPNAPAC